MNLKILIVDDASVSRKVMLKTLSLIGECVETKSGKKAISIFNKAYEEKKPFSLIILDISMPDIDGISVLRIIRKQEKQMKISKSKQIKIIMVSANARKADIKKCISLGCNSYISKPFKKEKLFKEFERLGFKVPEKINVEDDKQKSYPDLVAKIIKRFNKGEIKLPVLPHMVLEIQKLLKESEPSIEDLAKIVEKDAVISAKLISIANSSLYKGVETVTSLNAALLRLGLKETLSIVTTITNKNLYNSKNDSLKQLLNNLWLHSLACACCAKFLAEEITDTNFDGIFLMGILHDVGKVLLLKAIVDISPDEPLNDASLFSAIHEVHPVFGSVLIKKWGLSEKFIRAAELHHWSRYPKNTEKELLIIHLANIMIKKSGFSFLNQKSESESNSEYSPEFVATLKMLDIDFSRVEILNNMVIDAMKTLSAEL